jgi:dihydrodipicolinate synthase/N-acetylneuraminate lyase
MLTRNVIPIPPLYHSDEMLDEGSTAKYIRYLEDNGAGTIMTTAGTSQFNLMDIDEIHQLNDCVATECKCQKILGVPSLSSHETITFVIRASRTYADDSCHFMALYPDRFYDHDTIYGYLAKIRDAASVPLYLHAVAMRHGIDGSWDWGSDIISRLFEDDIVCGIKEEHSSLQKSYDFIRGLPERLDVIVAGGSMRRHSFLKTAGANSFLAGVGNFFPEVEARYCRGENADRQIELESLFFDVARKYGWHRCFRAALCCLGFSAFNRQPWPDSPKEMIRDIEMVLEVIREG